MRTCVLPGGCKNHHLCKDADACMVLMETINKSRPAAPLVERLEERLRNHSDEWPIELINLVAEAATALSLAQTEIKGHMRTEDELKERAARVADERDFLERNYKRIEAKLAEAQARIAELEKFLHSRCMHPDFEYGTTTGPRKAWYEHHTPDGEGWEKNVDEGRDGWDRFDYHEEAYWRRKKPAIDAALKSRA